MGGDILYRWGNPKAYKRGGDNDQLLFGQHDVHWIDEGLPDAGKLMIFNNGQNRPGGNRSSIDIIQPPVDASGQYVLDDDAPFGPEMVDWTYFPSIGNDFFAKNISGAQRLPNGNTLICEGPEGHLFEIEPDENVVWDFICPIGADGPAEQGVDLDLNSIFRAYRYGPDYPAFDGKDLSPGEVLELNPVPGPCDSPSAVTDVPNFQIDVIPNPFIDEVTILSDQNMNGILQLINHVGQVIYKERVDGKTISLKLGSNIPLGLYYLRFPQGQVKKIFCAH